jgi:hypothetical protein
MPAGLVLRIRVAPTEDGFAVAGVLVERDDGRAVTARDLRRVKLPPAWTLASQPLPESAAVRPAKPGPHGLGDDHWRAVLELRARAEGVAPRAPVRWMRAQWPGEPSDATMRRWIARARERAAELGWPPLLGFAVPPSVGRVVHMNAGRCRPQRPAFVHSGVVVHRRRQA